MNQLSWGKKHDFLFLAIKFFTATLYRKIFNIAQLIIYEATLRLEYFSCPIAFAIEGRRIPRKTKNNLWNSPRLCLMECIQSNFNNPWPDYLWQCFSNFNVHTNYLEILLKWTDQVGLGKSLRFCIYNKLLCEVVADGLWNRLWVART